jgi:hypothetical protein
MFRVLARTGLPRKKPLMLGEFDIGGAVEGPIV